ncbi:putative heavy metal transport/detoxification protein [Crocosphaera subtropica ATCC 51142]|uniref:Heavy metal transport/detoxification protein n=1 Tax=Crocosphaera subtropica (strain ATCC 51142 / BH68) TaxID=43989 RepID=B1WNJ1_CROS5|nr:heavy-metal-associated domain-containing protein [Crocosphaera subtropica]ACB49833.1 putative heavy metal transport/detoxification protein [Crocosphaera subtropica ATCC 51142]
MTITLKVPSIACGACANTITKAIEGQKPEAKVSVDVDSKIVTVETDASTETIKEIISEAGHTVED